MLTSTSRRPGQAVTPPKVSMDTDEDVLIFGESASMNDDIRRGLDEERHRLEEMTQMLSKQMAEETKEHHHILQQMTNQDVQHVGTGAKQVWEEMQMHQTMAQTLSESMGLELVVPDMDTEEGLQDQIHQAAATLRDQLTHLRRLKDALREKGDDSLELEEWQEKTRDKERSLADHQERLAKTQASMQKKTQVRTDLRQEWEQETTKAQQVAQDAKAKELQLQQDLQKIQDVVTKIQERNATLANHPWPIAPLEQGLGQIVTLNEAVTQAQSGRQVAKQRRQEGHAHKTKLETELATANESLRRYSARIASDQQKCDTLVRQNDKQQKVQQTQKAQMESLQAELASIKQAPVVTDQEESLQTRLQGMQETLLQREALLENRKAEYQAAKDDLTKAHEDLDEEDPSLQTLLSEKMQIDQKVHALEQEHEAARHARILRKAVQIKQATKQKERDLLGGLE